ncbi:hypothetical protein MRX96_006081 [Rhipicephalus microplus]
MRLKFSDCKIKRYASTLSTSNMQRHLVDEHKLQDDRKGASRVTVKNYFQVAPRRNTTSSSRKNLLARDLVLLISRDLLSFNLVNGERLQDSFVKYGLIKEFQELPDQTTLSRGRGSVPSRTTCGPTATGGEPTSHSLVTLLTTTSSLYR